MMNKETECTPVTKQDCFPPALMFMADEMESDIVVNSIQIIPSNTEGYSVIIYSLLSL